ncbi:MAG: TIGR01458 family HAD-type hydrolase [Chromatiales bacterium]|jgi:HAD superfamily hydrolase (TIGR01458 family)
MPLSCDAVFFDLSGVLYEGSQQINGAAELVQQARDKGLTLRFVTNTASKSQQQILDDLAAMQIAINPGELFTAPMAAKAYLEKHQLRPYYLLHEATRAEFADIDQHNPNCVLLGDARDGLHYQSLNKAFQLCKQGMPLIGVGMNKYFKDDNGLNLDAGPFIRAIEWASDTRAVIMGKPGREFFTEVVASTPYPAQRCLMIGDDVAADVNGAIDAGLQGCLVKTGKYQAGDEQQLPQGAHIIDNVTAVFEQQVVQVIDT